MITGQTIGERIAQRFPEASAELADVFEMWGEDDVGPAMYSYVSEGFFHPVFHPAVAARDLPRIQGCFAFVEELLSSPTEDLVDATCIRVLPWMVTPDWIDLTRQFAGPLTVERLAAHEGYNADNHA